MIKNNIWNRIFHRKELKQQKEKYLKAKSLIGFGPETLQFIKGAKDLDELLKAHKIAWIRGFQNGNLGPCLYGKFRTKDIAKMKPSEVYLGDIYGLWTFNIPHWNENKDVQMIGNGWGIPEDTKCYDLIMKQYAGLLESNIKSLIQRSKIFVEEYNKNQ